MILEYQRYVTMLLLIQVDEGIICATISLYSFKLIVCLSYAFGLLPKHKRQWHYLCFGVRGYRPSSYSSDPQICHPQIYTVLQVKLNESCDIINESGSFLALNCPSCKCKYFKWYLSTYYPNTSRKYYILGNYNYCYIFPDVQRVTSVQI